MLRIEGSRSLLVATLCATFVLGCGRQVPARNGGDASSRSAAHVTAAATPTSSLQHASAAPREALAAARSGGVHVPGSAVAALANGGAGSLAGTVAIPAEEEGPQGMPSAFTVVSLGVGAAGFLTAGIIIVASQPGPRTEVGVAVGPGQVAVAGAF
jgi:hypothetical protein